jgi:hypothetical protein
LRPQEEQREECAGGATKKEERGEEGIKRFAH